MSEFNFRFSLDNKPTQKGLNLNDMLGLHLGELLDIIIPVERQQDLRPDGFRVLSDPENIHPLTSLGEGKPEKGKGPLDLYEPRIAYIQRILESLLSIIDLEADGKTVSVNGFRLKELDKWLTPSGGAVDIIAHAASRCNLNCRFCYNKYEPPTLRPESKPPEGEYHEILERITHYVPGSKLNIFPTMGSPAEALAHPFILDILHQLRKKTTEIFRLSTNGSSLTSEMIQHLVALKPVYIDLSLNSSSLERRAWLMRDPECSVALNSLEHLRNAGIPYAIVIVPWPFPSADIMINDLKNTIAFADSFDPALIQISLPGYGRSSYPEECFSHEEVWNRIKTTIQELRYHTDCPIVMRPGLYEEADHPEKVNDPLVIGVIKNSPSYLAGLHPGDRILKVNGLPMKNRPQTRSLLKTLNESDLAMTSLSVQRGSNLMDLDLNLREFDYPYTLESATQLGVVFASSGIPEEWVVRLKEIIISRQGKEVLLFSSALVKPVLKKLISDKGFIPDINLYIRVPENHYFGGNICMGDLMVVEDFIKAIEEFINTEKIQPDLVIIPSSPFHLSGWGRDLTGRVYLDIERRTKISVALVECETIFD
jgi:uncharacterized Fe-S cluster-containing radical SAM superfamily protein